MKESRIFTLIELLVVVAIIAILASLLLPSLSKARDKSSSMKCQGNLRQLGVATMGYISDYGESLPAANRISEDINNCGRIAMNKLAPYLNAKDKSGSYMAYKDNAIPALGHSSQVYCCPSLPDKPIDNFAWSHYLVGNAWAAPVYLRLVQVKTPSKMLAIVDALGHTANYYDVIYDPTSKCIDCRHSGFGNALLLDGHSQSVPAIVFAAKGFAIFDGATSW